MAETTVRLDVNIMTDGGMLMADTVMPLPAGVDWLARGLCHVYEPTDEVAESFEDETGEGLTDDDLVSIKALRGKNVQDLKQALAGVDSIDVLSALLADEERKGAIDAIDARMDELLSGEDEA